MQEQLMTHMDEIMSWVKQAGEFVKDQAPDYVNQLLTYHYVMAWITIITGIGVVLLLSVLPLMGWRSYKRSRDSLAFGCLLVGVFILYIFPLGILIGPGLADTLKIKMAPKVFIIEHIQAHLNK